MPPVYLSRRKDRGPRKLRVRCHSKVEVDHVGIYPREKLADMSGGVPGAIRTMLEIK